MEFLLQPGVYSTGSNTNLLSMLDDMWIKTHTEGEGTLYIISGFANYNGGVRFYPYFTRHIQNGGRIIAYFGGSTSQRLSSEQVVEALIQCGADVNVVNRKRLLHAKCYGFSTEEKEELIVTSGNFTGPGMSQNAEASLRINTNNVREMNFSWEHLINGISSQNWDIYHVDKDDLASKSSPVWTLLYDEVHGVSQIEEDQQLTMIITLNSSDTARIQANPGSNAGKGSQYFWLSKTAFDFFPALTEKNRRGYKNTYSCLINMNYVDLGETKQERVTFEAENNLDFRLGTGALRYTKRAKKQDLALITRLEEYNYELRIIPTESIIYSTLLSYATTFIGGQGKRFGYINNSDLYKILSSHT